MTTSDGLRISESVALFEFVLPADTPLYAIAGGNVAIRVIAIPLLQPNQRLS